MLWRYRKCQKMKFEGDWAELWANIFFSDNPGQNIWNKIEKSNKIAQGSFFSFFGQLLPMFNFWKGDWALGLDFFNISYFLLFYISLKLTRETTRTPTLLFRFGFTRDKLDLYYKNVKSQNIMTTIVGTRIFIFCSCWNKPRNFMVTIFSVPWRFPELLLIYRKDL